MEQEFKLSNSKIKLVLLALAITAFSIGTTEFIAVGLLPDISKTFNISGSLAGLMVSGYAIGVAIGAPVLTTLTRKLSRKNVLILLMLIFLGGNLLVALATNFWVLISARIITALAHGIFFSIGSTIAAELVPENKRASAISIVFTGLTIATITGVPLGTYIANTFSWRVSFGLIIVFGIISLIGILFIIPRNMYNESTSISKQLVIFKDGEMIRVYVLTALGYGGTFVVYTYISTILEKIMGYSAGELSIILLIYGVFLSIGNTVGGKVSNNKTLKSLVIIFLIQAIALFIFGALLHFKYAGLAALMFLGLFAFMSVPGLQVYVFKITQKKFPESSDLASSINIAAFNIGIAGGSLIGSKVIGILGLTYTPYVAGIVVLIASFIGLMGLSKKDKID